MIRKAGKIILLIIIYAIAAIPAVYINTLYGYLPIIFLAISIILSLLCLQIVRKKIEVTSDVEKEKSVCERGEKVSAGLRIINRSMITTGKTVANVYISDLFGGEDAMNRMQLSLAPREESGFGMNIAMPHIGVYRGGIRDVEMWDWFGLRKTRVPAEGSFEVFVRPKIRPLEDLWDSEIVYTESMKDTRTVVMGGMDYIGVREYVMGDSMKQIHWKLSAHSQGYMTKLQESSRELDYAVVLDFAAEKVEDTEVLMDIQDSLIETSLSIIDSVAQKHSNYSLIYANRDQEIVRYQPRGREDDLTLIQDFSLITPEPDERYPDACRILLEEGSAANRSTNVIVVTSRVTDELLQELMRIRRQQRVPELYHIVPAGLNSREVGAILARLQQLDEVGVNHCLVYTTDAGGVAA